MALHHAAQALANRLPFLSALLADRRRLYAELQQAQTELLHLRAARDQWTHGNRYVPPGHYYSPIPKVEQVLQDWPRIGPDSGKRSFEGIDLREADQFALLHRLARNYGNLPFRPEKQPGLRYFYENGAFSYADAILLALLLQETQPRRLIEIGSGHSSCLTLDTTERFLPGRVQLTFIEPYPELLNELLRPGDADRVTVIQSRVQDVSLDTFEALEPNDILFIDSTHVARAGSDVNHLFHEVLPRLRPGVLVHLHDIFYPFEYPLRWLEQGRAWNEAYLLRAYLEENPRWQIVLWNELMIRFHPEFFAQSMPLCLKNEGGGFWMRRV